MSRPGLRHVPSYLEPKLIAKFVELMECLAVAKIPEAIHGALS